MKQNAENIYSRESLIVVVDFSIIIVNLFWRRFRFSTFYFLKTNFVKYVRFSEHFRGIQGQRSRRAWIFDTFPKTFDIVFTFDGILENCSSFNSSETDSYCTFGRILTWYCVSSWFEISVCCRLDAYNLTNIRFLHLAVQVK